MSNNFFDDDPMYSEITTPGKSGPPPSSIGAIVSLILGGGTLLLVWANTLFFVLSIIFILINIVGIVLAVSARKRCYSRGYPSGLATFALVVNILSLILHSIMFIACTACVACAFTLF